MTNILDQITNLIVQPSGSMVYHLVLAFIFISVLQPALSFIPSEKKEQRKRLLTGVILLIASRLVVFIASIFSILGFAGASNALGVVEQAVNAFDITIMIWLFAFPTKHKAGDLGLALFGLFFLAGGIISTIFWGIQGQMGTYNQSSLAFGWEIITVVIVIVGLITINRSHSSAQTQGMIMMAILLIGEAIQMIYAIEEGDYFPISRLAHLIAFPLLVGIVQNFTSEAQSFALPEARSDTLRKKETGEEDQIESETLDLISAQQPESENELSDAEPRSVSKSLDLETYQNSIALAAATDPQEICKLFTKLTAHALLADLCLLLTPPDDSQQVHLICGYDLIIQEYLKATAFDSNLIPRFSKIFENGRSIHLLDQGNEKMHEFADLLRVDDIGNMMAYPVLGKDDEVIAVITLVSPYSKHVWNADDLQYLQDAIPQISPLLEQTLAPKPEDLLIESLEENLEIAATEKQQLEQEKQTLEAQIAELSMKVEAGPPLPPEIEDLVVQTQSLESALNLSQEENRSLKEKIDQLTDENTSLEDEKQKILTEKQNLAKEHARLLEEQRVLATEHAYVLEEKAILENQTEISQDTQAQLDALTYANEELVQKNQELLAETKKLGDEKNELKELSEELAQRNTEIGKQNQTLTDQLKELTENNTYLNENLDQLQKEQEEILTNLSDGDDKSIHLKEELKNALEQVEEFELKLNEANEALDTLKQFKTKINGQSISNEQEEVIASIAQELRQPMSSISGYTDLLISESVGILGALQKKFLERVKASTERMNQLVNDLVHVTTIDSGNFLFTLQPLELMDVIDNAIETTSGQFREKEISLRVNISPNLPKLHTDKDALQQIVLHLLQNAGTATPTEGEVLLKAQMYDKTNDDVILLSITDTGEGIPKEDLPRVFSRLYRADNPLIQGVGDTGVGLSIAKTLAEALGGRIWVESETNSGSTYSVLLPTTSPTLTQQEG